MDYFFCRKIGNVEVVAFVSAKEIIGADAKIICYFYEHFDGRSHVVVFPVAHALFRKP